MVLLAEAVSAVTGWDFTPEEAKSVGLRAVNLMRAFNIRGGIMKELDYPSTRYGSTHTDGPWKGIGIMPHWEEMLENYYRLMGWDVETGKPLPETLKKLGLDGESVTLSVADDGRGIDPQVARRHPGGAGGMGIPAIRERLQGLGGYLRLESEPGQGSCLVAVIPVGEQEQD